MFLLFRYPHEKGASLVALLDRNYDLFWRAADVARLFGYKNGGHAVRSRLKNEAVSRYADVAVSRARQGGGNALVLDCEQVLRFAERVPIEKRKWTFEGWFRGVLEGTQYLHPANDVEFRHFTERPEECDLPEKAVCLSSVFPSADGTAFYREEVPPSCRQPEKEKTDGGRLTPIAEEERENAGAEGDRTAAAPLLAEGGISARGTGEEGGGKNPVCLNQIFKLPDLVSHLRERAKSSSGSIGTSGGNSSNPPWSRNLPVDNARASVVTKGRGKQKTRVYDDRFKLEIDEALSYRFVDSPFETEYKFYAIKTNFSFDSRSMSVNPYMCTVNDNIYLFFPVKKETSHRIG